MAKMWLLLFVGAMLPAGTGWAQNEKLSFEVASIRESKEGGASSMNFPLNIGPQYNAKGGLLTARGVPLLQLLVFAYAKSLYQIQVMRTELPVWARETRFDVSARAEGSPSKDEMRAMMRTLLEERFGMKAHMESRQVDVLRLVPATPGKLGLRLRAFAESEAPCAEEAPAWGRMPGQPAAVSVKTVDGGYPAYCGAVVVLTDEAPGQMKVGGRKVSMADIAVAVGGAADIVDRPVLDGTGMPGTFDVMLEFAMDYPDPARAGSDAPMGPSLAAALKEQLGLKMKSGKGAVEVVVLDKLQKPSQN